MNLQIPIHISGTDALNSIGENIILADNNYKITWFNAKAYKSLSVIAPLFGIENAEDVIGLEMDFFHKKPEFQRYIMSNLQERHRARINIKGMFVADIVVTPITNNEDPDHTVGYMVMLMDVTTKAEEEKKKEKLIRDLSFPILNIWDKTIALPLVGEFDLNRGENVIPLVLEECVSKNIEYVMVSLRGISSFDASARQNIEKLCYCLKLIGVECIIVGIKPEMAINIGELSNIRTLSNANDGLKYIIERQGDKLVKNI